VHPYRLQPTAAGVADPGSPPVISRAIIALHPTNCCSESTIRDHTMLLDSWGTARLMFGRDHSGHGAAASIRNPLHALTGLGHDFVLKPSHAFAIP
jgi:hypothetical protein